jgi:hypothetical protein
MRVKMEKKGQSHRFCTPKDWAAAGGIHFELLG